MDLEAIGGVTGLTALATGAGVFFGRWLALRSAERRDFLGKALERIAALEARTASLTEDVRVERDKRTAEAIEHAGQTAQFESRIAQLERELTDERNKRSATASEHAGETARFESRIAQLERELTDERNENKRLRDVRCPVSPDGVCVAVGGVTMRPEKK